jgi:hypothetical protein
MSHPMKQTSEIFYWKIDKLFLSFSNNNLCNQIKVIMQTLQLNELYIFQLTI